jgi:4-carboxymuconolactone decarboxylase
LAPESVEIAYEIDDNALVSGDPVYFIGAFDPLAIGYLGGTMTRFSIAEGGWNEEQRALAEALRGSARGKIGEPFLNLLPLPRLATRVADLGALLRFEGVLPAEIRELVTLVVAEHWRCAYEWRGHAALALKAGLTAATLSAIHAGSLPDEATAAQKAAWRAARAVLENGRLGDADFAGLQETFGREGALELVALCGYYGLLALVINVGRADADQPDWDEVLDGVA